jgi:hypothetical protein
MINRISKAISFFSVVLLLCGTGEMLAQEPADHLVISQVCFNDKQSAKNWIEVYNPTDKPLVLQRIRISHLKTINVLPESIQREGGIQVGAGECVILCSDENVFKSLYGIEAKVIMVNVLSRISSGGFVLITTKDVGESKGAVVRYGEKEISYNISQLAGDQVVGFSEDGKSFKRMVSKSENGFTLSDFVESPATPGKTNN